MQQSTLPGRAASHERTTLRERATLRERTDGKLPAELVNILGTSAAILAVVGAGSAIVTVMPQPSAWEFAAAYLAPASLAFAIYWWIAQKL